jgi:hypothetical protein
MSNNEDKIDCSFDCVMYSSKASAEAQQWAPKFVSLPKMGTNAQECTLKLVHLNGATYASKRRPPWTHIRNKTTELFPPFLWHAHNNGSKCNIGYSSAFGYAS